VQLYKHTPLVFKASRQLKKDGIVGYPVVKVEGGAAMVAGKMGEGKFFVSSDISAFLPFRAEYGDNAALMANVIGWLVGKEADDAFRAKVRGNLFLTEADFAKINAEEK